jgi:hypothetical protein
MTQRTIYNVFEFDPHSSAGPLLSDSSKIGVTSCGKVELKKQLDDSYPTDDDIYVRTPVESLGALRALVAIEPVVVIPRKNGVPQAEVYFRLYNGTSEFYWNGVSSAWEVAGPTDWTTMTDLQANFAAYMLVADKKVSVVVNLRSVDGKQTPAVMRIIYAFQAEVPSFVEEYLYRSLFHRLREYVRPLVDWSLVWPGGTTYDLSGYRAENSYRILDVLEVYDLANDPDLETNIISGYDENTKILTLTQPIAASERVFVRFVPKIIFAVSTHSDWHDIAHLPAVVFRDYSKNINGESPKRPSVVNHDTLETVYTESPRRVDYDIPVDILAEKGSIVPRIMELIQQLSQVDPIIVTTGIAAKARLEVVEDTAFFPRADEEGMLRGVLRVGLMNCAEWYFASGQGHAIKQVVVGTELADDC